MVAHADLSVAHSDLDLTPVRAPLGGIVEQVRHGPVEAARHAGDQARLELREEHLVGRVAARTLDRLLDQLVEPHVLHARTGLIATGEVEEGREPENPAAVLGRRGGAARAKALTPEQRAEIARKAAAKRWKGKE